MSLSHLLPLCGMFTLKGSNASLGPAHGLGGWCVVQTGSQARTADLPWPAVYCSRKVFTVRLDLLFSPLRWTRHGITALFLPSNITEVSICEATKRSIITALRCEVPGLQIMSWAVRCRRGHPSPARRPPSRRPRRCCGHHRWCCVAAVAAVCGFLTLRPSVLLPRPSRRSLTQKLQLFKKTFLRRTQQRGKKGKTHSSSTVPSPLTKTTHK